MEIIEEESIRKSWESESLKRINSDEQTFDAWFDDSDSLRQSIANGMIDFYHRILTPKIYPHLGDPRDKTCLEIGFGGGRLMNAALNVFQHAYGVDVHSREVFDRVKFRLQCSHGASRFDLIHRDSIDVIPDLSVDFAYSFIVFQHFGSIDEVKRYFLMLNRVMKKGAVGKIFYVQTPTWNGPSVVNVEQFSKNPRAETLAISPKDMFNIIDNAGMLRLDWEHAGQKKMWDFNLGSSSQHVVTFAKA